MEKLTKNQCTVILYLQKMFEQMTKITVFLTFFIHILDGFLRTCHENYVLHFFLQLFWASYGQQSL